MTRVLAIDYGTKRVGIAVTDPERIIANPLTTVHPNDLIDYLKTYLRSEEVGIIVVGLPMKLDNTETSMTPIIKNFVKHLTKVFMNIKIVTIDERYTSKMAFDSILAMGVKKKDRKKKENIDKISATIILQSFLQQEGNL